MGSLAAQRLPPPQTRRWRFLDPVDKGWRQLLLPGLGWNSAIQSLPSNIPHPDQVTQKNPLLSALKSPLLSDPRSPLSPSVSPSSCNIDEIHSFSRVSVSPSVKTGRGRTFILVTSQTRKSLVKSSYHLQNVQHLNNYYYPMATGELRPERNHGWEFPLPHAVQTP